MGYRTNERGKFSEDFVASGEGLVAFGATLILAVQTHYGAAELLRGKRSAQTAATPNRPSSLITNAAKISPYKPPPAQPHEEIRGLIPAPRRLAAARPPQPRESGPASHPNTGPGAEGGGGWPMHATAQPWHAQDVRCRPQLLVAPAQRIPMTPAKHPRLFLASITSAQTLGAKTVLPGQSAQGTRRRDS